MCASLREWIDKYNRKTPEPFKRDERFELFFSPEKGFCEAGTSPDGKMLIIHQLCGDGKFFKQKIEEAARASGIKMCGTWFVRRDIKAYIRLFGYRVEEEETLPDGSKRYRLREKNTDRQGFASPAWRYATNERAYLITWEV